MRFAFAGSAAQVGLKDESARNGATTDADGDINKHEMFLERSFNQQSQTSVKEARSVAFICVVGGKSEGGRIKAAEIRGIALPRNRGSRPIDLQYIPS